MQVQHNLNNQTQTSSNNTQSSQNPLKSILKTPKKDITNDHQGDKKPSGSKVNFASEIKTVKIYQLGKNEAKEKRETTKNIQIEREKEKLKTAQKQIKDLKKQMEIFEKKLNNTST